MTSYKVTVDPAVDSSLVPVRLYDRDAEIVFNDFDDDGNAIYDVDVNGDIDTILDQCLGLISYEQVAQGAITKGWTTDEVAVMFDTVSTSTTGYQKFIPIGNPIASEWGVDVVVLSEQPNGNHTVAYRLSNTMIDEDWKIGNLDDVVEALDTQEENWLMFDNPEQEIA